MSELKKVLFVSYVFPPMAAVGSQRVVNFCRFLPDYGWQPVVLTVKKGHNTSWDDSLLKKIPDTIVYRTPIFEPYLWLSSLRGTKKETFSKDVIATKQAETVKKVSILKKIKKYILLFLRVPDEIIFWLPFAVYRGIRVVKKEQISAIISTSPPVTSHICASLIARFTKIPHIIDFRDLWTLNHTYSQRDYPPFFKKYDKWWEKKVLDHGSEIITASPGFTNLLQKNLSLNKKVKTITNGFDYTEIELNKIFESPAQGKMNIIYTGSIYSDFNPEFFFEALSEWIQENKIDPNSVTVNFYGNCGYDYTAWLKQLQLETLVHFHGFVPREQLFKKMEVANYLLLLLGFKDEYKNVIPAKLFDYLATSTKIIAIAPMGVSVDLIRKYQAGYWQCTPDKTAMKGLLNQLYSEVMQKKCEKKEYRYIQEIDRLYLTKELAQILDKQKEKY